MRFLKLSALTIALITPQISQAETPTYDEETVKAECSLDWGTEYDMVAYCIKKRDQGFQEFMTHLTNATDELAPAMTNCQTVWGAEWDMVAYCGKKQLDALPEMASAITAIPDDIGTEIIATCKSEWPVEMDMAAYCTRKRADAWRQINQ